MSDDGLTCELCGRGGFESQRGLTRHKLDKNGCIANLKKKFGASADIKTAAAYLPVAEVFNPQKRLPGTDNAMEYSHLSDQLGAKKAKFMSMPDKLFTSAWIAKAQAQLDQAQMLDDSDTDMPTFDDNDGDEIGFVQGSSDSQTAMIDNFRAYTKEAQDFVALDSEKLATAISLLQVLRRTKASLGTYDSLMHWYLENRYLLNPRDSLAKSPHYLPQKKVYQALKRRYNRAQGYGIKTKIVLPGTKARAIMITNEAIMVMQSLLTEPRVRPKDYLFNDQNDPFAPPPADLDYIADLNTGQSYIQTWHKLITKPGKQILCPIILYVDGAATGQFVDLPITAVQIALGIHTRKAREKGYLWGTLGYTPSPTKIKSTGQRQLVDSGHHDSTIPCFEMLDDEGQVRLQETEKGKNKAKQDNQDKPDALRKSQDLHAMLDFILAGLVKLQKEGLKWDLIYNGRAYNDVEFVFFVPFIRCDADEADKLCGSYTNRGRNVSQLCRYCMCPTLQSDNIRAKFKKKTPKRIAKLVEKNDAEGLQELSQQNIDNALCKIRFGAHSDQGVHGACPLEMLHATLLGHCATVRDTFFEQIGPTSATAKNLNTLASEFGRLLSRQCDRDMPKTKFSGGIRRGKLMAKEYTGIILVLLITIKSPKGRELMRYRRPHFQKPDVLQDWIMLLETLLQWIEWLQSTVMPLRDVERCPKKFQHIMYLMKRIADRKTGMGLMTTKFHCMLHIPEDMVAYGVPLEVDTRFNEMHHKPSKAAAALTQKDKSKFEEQVHQRREEVILLELAEEEMEGRAVQNYYSGHTFDPQHTTVKPDKTGGQCFVVETHPESGRNFMWDPSDNKGKGKKIHVELALVNFLIDIQDQVHWDIPRVKLFTLHRRNGQIFRGSACFRGSAWRDWVVVDWGRGYGKLPNKIWGFIDLTQLKRRGINIGGIRNLQPGVYAVVEATEYPEKPDNTELITEIEVEVDGFTPEGFVSGIRFYLANVEAFVEPAVVVPNIGGKNNSYMWLSARHTWRDSFVRWLHQPYHMGNLSDSEASESEGEIPGDDVSVASAEEEQEEEDTDSDDDDTIAEQEAVLDES